MSKNAKIRKAQKWIQEMGADGWLIYDFHKNNGSSGKSVPGHRGSGK